MNSSLSKSIPTFNMSLIKLHMGFCFIVWDSYSALKYLNIEESFKEQFYRT